MTGKTASNTVPKPTEWIIENVLPNGLVRLGVLQERLEVRNPVGNNRLKGLSVANGPKRLLSNAR